MFRRQARAALVITLALVGGACGGGDGGEDEPDGPTEALTGEVLVYAAASLTDAFAEIEAAFEEANDGVDVVLNLGPSSGLREQVLAGAPADVFASANTSNMDQLVDAGAAADPAPFVTNELQIAVPAGNPGAIDGLGDFADDDLLIGLCAEAVPCGQFAMESLTAAGVTPAVDTFATDVRALLTQLASGDLDAGIVYRTDVLAADGTVDGIDIPAEHNVTATYPIAALTEAPNPEAAVAFLAFVRSAVGQAILASYGFSAP
jgi:molybdate transport system substrate-binding protein